MVQKRVHFPSLCFERSGMSTFNGLGLNVEIPAPQNTNWESGLIFEVDDVIELRGKHWRHTHVDWILTK